MKIWKKALVVLVLAATVMGVASMQYAKLGVSFQYKIDTPTSLIQLMAGDGAVVGSGYVLTNNADTYEVHLGTFAQGFSKTYTAAFAIVNSESNVKLRITKIDAGSNQPLVIALHKHKDANVLNDSGDGIIYYDPNHGAYDHSSDGYVLANGAGAYDTGSNPLKYADKASWPPNSGEWVSATYDGTNNVWTPGATVDAPDLTTASGTTGANFVWVQITIANTAAAGPYTGTIDIYVQSV